MKYEHAEFNFVDADNRFVKRLVFKNTWKEVHIAAWILILMYFSKNYVCNICKVDQLQCNSYYISLFVETVVC